ncbi:MAG: DUF1729 domain-containing protein, partial [Myxococcales bacterium]|nr:DUF1729 domain-containing protein [Myxococcales bacterium]
MSWGRGPSDAPMVAVSGWDRARLAAHLKGLDAGITLTNTADRFVVSGTPAAVAQLQVRIAQTVAKAEAANAKSLGLQEPAPVVEPLATSAPFHSRWMADAVRPIQAHAARLGLRFDPAALQIPVLRYEDGQPWDGTPDLFESMCLHPVDWQTTCRALAARKVTHVVDLGPGGGVAALAGLNLAGQGVRVVAAAERNGQATLGAADPAAFATPATWASLAPVAERGEGGLKLRNRFTALTGCPPVFLPGMTPTTADTPIIVAAANAGLFAELAGGGQPTEAILRKRAARLREQLAPGAGYVFNALYLDPYLWGLHLGRDKLVLRLKAEGHPIDGVTVSAGLPPVDEAVALLAEWRAAGITRNSFKAGSDAQIEHVLRIADADGGDVILQVEGGRAGGHHGFHDLEGMLLRWYARIRRRPNVVLAVGGGVGDGARVKALLDGTWAQAHDRPVMPVDAVFVGTVAMACAEAETAPAVKRALAAAQGSPKLLGRGQVDGAVRSGRSGLGADIHYLDNHAGRVAALLDEVAGNPQAAAARHAEIAAALAPTAKPWFGPLDGTYRALLDRLVDLMALGRGGEFEDGVWLAADHRARFGDTLRRALQRCECAGPLPTNADLDDPRAAVQRAAQRCPALDSRRVLLEDQRWFVESVCKRPGKPVPFVPVIDGDVHRWFTRDALWQSHDPRFDAEGVLVIPGPTAVAGIDRVDEPVAELFTRLMAPAIQGAPQRAGHTEDPVATAHAADTVTWAGATVLNPVPAALAGSALRERRRLLGGDGDGGRQRAVRRLLGEPG